MVDLSPKAIIIDYFAIINNCLIDFFDECNSFFTNENGTYCLANTISKRKLSKILYEDIRKEIFNAIDLTRQREQFKSLTKKFFILNSCFVEDHYIQKFIEENEEKEDFKAKFDLIEKDIKLDFVLFTTEFDKIFNKLLKEQIRNKNRDIFYLQNTELSFSDLKKRIIEFFGENNSFDISKDLIKRECINKREIPQTKFIFSNRQKKKEVIKYISLLNREVDDFINNILNT